MPNAYTTTTFIGNFVYQNGVLMWHNFDEGRVVYNKGLSVSRTEIFLKDHLGNVRVVYDNSTGEPVQHTNYYPFGMQMYTPPTLSATININEYLYNGKMYQDELGLGWYDYGARFYDEVVGRWWVVDPMIEKHYDYTPYAYVYNNPIKFIDPFGLDSLYVLDQGTRPSDNGTTGQTYTADVYAVQNGIINGPYSGSSYPNSISNSNNSTNSNTANEGEHQYNNASGHKGGKQQGLNLVDTNGNRNTPGTDPNGTAVSMTYVNVHEGASDNGNYNSRGSQGCITINPNDAANFFGNFDWSGTNGNTGNSTGTLFIQRGTNAVNTRTRLQQMQDWQQNPLQTIQPLGVVSINP